MRCSTGGLLAAHKFTRYCAPTILHPDARGRYIFIRFSLDKLMKIIYNLYITLLNCENDSMAYKIIQRCNRPARSGKPCQIPLRGGKCMTHDADLSARNKAVAASFKANNPEAFAAQRRTAGKLGFQATGGMHGWAKANEMARKWRLKNPSGPEREVINALKRLGLTDYEREYALPDGKSIDFAWPLHKIGIEVNGHQYRASFGEDEPRASRQYEKIKALIEAGWKIIIIDMASGEMPEDKVKTLKEFLEKELENHATSSI